MRALETVDITGNAINLIALNTIHYHLFFSPIPIAYFIIGGLIGCRIDALFHVTDFLIARNALGHSATRKKHRNLIFSFIYSYIL